MERGQTYARAVRSQKANSEMLRSPSNRWNVHLEARTRIPVEVLQDPNRYHLDAADQAWGGDN